MVFDHYHGKGSELLLAVKLADNAHDDGTSIYPSVATLAVQTRQSERTVQYQLKRMVDTGWLVLVKHAVGGGRAGGYGRPREYRIDPLWIRAHDSRVPPEQRPVWVPKEQKPPKEMGAEIAPISLGAGPLAEHEMGAIAIAPDLNKWVQPSAEMGATAVAEMGAIAVAPEPSLTVIEPNTPLPPDGGEPGFENFYTEYPRQVEEVKARAAWERLAPDAALQREIMAAVACWRQSAEWQREGGRFIPKPAKWLRNKRWRDIPGVVSPPRPPAPPPEPPRQASPVPVHLRATIESLLGSRAGRHRDGALKLTRVAPATPPIGTSTGVGHTGNSTPALAPVAGLGQSPVNSPKVAG